jgi:prostaglandin-endoperoxide synthase 2
LWKQGVWKWKYSKKNYQCCWQAMSARWYPVKIKAKPQLLSSPPTSNITVITSSSYGIASLSTQLGVTFYKITATANKKRAMIMNLINRLVNAVSVIPGVGEIINRIATNSACNSTTPRPRAFSLWSHIPKPVTNSDEQGPVSNYTSWPMLTDRSYSTRHLPPASEKYIAELPEDHHPTEDNSGQVTDLFLRKGEIKKGRSTVLFTFFAQWFTDSILRVDPSDRRKNTSTHNIDLCQIYGLTEFTANILRSKNEGKLRSQIINGEEFPEYLGEFVDGKWNVKDTFKNLPYSNETILEKIFEGWSEEKKLKAYATGLERGNSSVGYIAISVIFLREHNRICDKLKADNQEWDDERLFQTARMINIVILMKLVVEDYIGHISGFDVLKFDRSFAEKQNWYRTPWISIEFDMLYRWHGLVPENISVEGENYLHTEYRSDNKLLEIKGVGTIINAISSQHAGKIELENSPQFMQHAEYHMIKMGRDFRLQSYNAYRQQFGLKKLKSFNDLTDNKILKRKLESMYSSIDNVEYIVGVFAETHSKGKLFGELMYTMVSYDAFTQIYTNPLLSSNVYTAETFTKYGLDLIKHTHSIVSLIERNTSSKSNAKFGLDVA